MLSLSFGIIQQTKFPYLKIRAIPNSARSKATKKLYSNCTFFSFTQAVLADFSETSHSIKNNKESQEMDIMSSVHLKCSLGIENTFQTAFYKGIFSNKHFNLCYLYYFMVLKM